MNEILGTPDQRLSARERKLLVEKTRKIITDTNDTVNNYVRIIIGDEEFEAAQALIKSYIETPSNEKLLDNEMFKRFSHTYRAILQQLSILYAESTGIQHPMEVIPNTHSIHIRCYDTIAENFLSFFSPQPPNGMTSEEGVVSFSGKQISLNGDPVKTKRQQMDIEAILRPLGPIIDQLNEDASHYWGEARPSPGPGSVSESSGTARRIREVLPLLLKKFRR